MYETADAKTKPLDSIAAILSNLYFSIILNKKEKIKYTYRFLGLINSIFGKKASFRLED